MRKKTNLCLSALLLGRALYGQATASSAPPTNAWLKVGGNLYSQNFSPLTQINRQNVANLKAVWRARLEGSGVGAKYSGEAQPVFYQGVVYIVTGADDVFASSVTTGEVPMEIPRRSGFIHLHRVLRLDQPRPGAGRRQGFRGTAGRPPGGP